MGCNTFLAMSGHCYGEEQPGLVNRCYSSSVATVIEYSPHLQGRQSQRLQTPCNTRDSAHVSPFCQDISQPTSKPHCHFAKEPVQDTICPRGGSASNRDERRKRPLCVTIIITSLVATRSYLKTRADRNSSNSELVSP